jgi:DNA-binding beta-propeller fold protein YncE
VRVRLLPAVLLAVAAAGVVAIATTMGSGSRADQTAPATQPTVRTTAPQAAPARPSRPARPSAARRLRHLVTITGDLSPKSVVASQRGLFFAQNMIYRHTISVYDRRFRLVRTIPDAVDLGRLGPPGASGTVRGGPVEAAFSSDGSRAYVSNYSMYGPGYGRPGDDVCSPGSGIDDSFVYRIDVARLRIDRAIRVGAVPKFLAVTPDDRYVLVSNWCTYDLSVVSVKRAREVRRIPLGAYPRGIAVGPGGGYAYVAVMGSRDIARIRLEDLSVSWLRGVGSAPRHLVMDPGGDFLYATLNAEGRVVKIDLRSGRVVARVATGSAPRSMAIAGDGRSLYVVNYSSGTVSKLRTRDMRVLQTVSTNGLPIGIDYDNDTHNLWVACYSGSLMVFRDV